MATYAIAYLYTNDTAGRDTHRDEHKAFLSSLGEQGTLKVSGPYGTDDTPGALLLITADSKSAAIAAIQGDPFQTHGLVAKVTAQEWIPMTGPLADSF